MPRVAIRDNEDAASAIGKNIVKQHLQVFIIGSAVVGIAGAMLTTLDGQFTPGSYQPLRFTFIVWIMVILIRVEEELSKAQLTHLEYL